MKQGAGARLPDVRSDASAFYARLKALLDGGERVALCTVIRLAGSGPRRAGAKMLVRERGGSEGTVGGGALEACATGWAHEALAGGGVVCRTFALDRTAPAGDGMTCGGQAELLIEPFQEFAPGAKVFFAELCARLCRGERGWLATAIRPEGNTLFVERFLLAGSACVGSLAAPDQVLPEDLCRAKTPDAPCLVERGALRYFLEPLAPPVTVYVFGGGHIAARLVPLCRLLGFRVAVVDDRAEYASPERFPDAGSLVVASFDQAVKSLPIDEESYAVIATRGHDSDAAILRHALALRPRYIGMIGSVRKRDLIFDQLRREGVSADALGRVACPIGLSIGAETPEEIAVSIAAELVAARAGVKTRNAG